VDAIILLVAAVAILGMIVCLFVIVDARSKMTIKINAGRRIEQQYDSWGYPLGARQYSLGSELQLIRDYRQKFGRDVLVRRVYVATLLIPATIVAMMIFMTLVAG